MPQIVLEKCSYTYQVGTKFANVGLEPLDLRIEQGELLAVTGRGGSGKSTLTLLMSGLYVPTSGKVLIDGKICAPGEIFPEVAIVFQYPEQQLFSETVFDEVAFALRNFGIAEESIAPRVQRALQTVGLDADSAHRQSPFNLSGGQKRRLCIACALAMEPKIYIFDEPTAGLDIAGRQWIRELMLDLNGQGSTVIWVSHDLSDVAEIAGRMIVLSEGHLLLDGSPKDILGAEEKLAEAGLKAPPAAALVRRLRERGLPLNGTAITAGDAAKEILAYLEGLRHAER